MAGRQIADAMWYGPVSRASLRTGDRILLKLETGFGAPSSFPNNIGKSCRDAVSARAIA